MQFFNTCLNQIHIAYTQRMWKNKNKIHPKSMNQPKITYKNRRFVRIKGFFFYLSDMWRCVNNKKEIRKPQSGSTSGSSPKYEQSSMESKHNRNRREDKYLCGDTYFVTHSDRHKDCVYIIFCLFEPYDAWCVGSTGLTKRPCDVWPAIKRRRIYV